MIYHTGILTNLLKVAIMYLLIANHLSGFLVKFVKNEEKKPKRGLGKINDYWHYLLGLFIWQNSP